MRNTLNITCVGRTTPEEDDIEPHEQERQHIDAGADACSPACCLADHRLRTTIRARGLADRVDVGRHAFGLRPDAFHEMTDNSEALARLMRTSVEQVEAGDQRFASVAAADGLPHAAHRTHPETETVLGVVELAREHGDAHRDVVADDRRTALALGARCVPLIAPGGRVNGCRRPSSSAVPADDHCTTPPQEEHP